MSWLWQGVIVTVAGGLILAIIIALAKYTGQQTEKARIQMSSTDVEQLENKIVSIRKSYRTAAAFYKDFDSAAWMKKTPELYRLPKRHQKTLKSKWVRETDFTKSFDYTNIDLMKLQVVKKYLTKKDLTELTDQPTVDQYGNDQKAGNLEFMKSMQEQFPRKISKHVAKWIKDNDEGTE